MKKKEIDPNRLICPDCKQMINTRGDCFCTTGKLKELKKKQREERRKVR